MAEATKTDDSYTLTAPALLSFPNLLEARAVKVRGKDSGEPKFSANFEFDANHPDLKPLKDKAIAVARARWPGRPLTELAFPFTSGDKLAAKAEANSKERAWSKGKAVLTSRSKFEPALAAVVNGKWVDFDGEARARAKPYFYTGVEALARFTFVAYDGVGQNPDGVTAYLNQVGSLNKGERLTGGLAASDTFKGYIGIDSDEDPTAGDGLDDEIPF